jgi:ribokinase
MIQFSYMKNQVCVIGGATWDVLFTTPQACLLPVSKTRQSFLAFPYGSKVDAKDITYCFGGGAANVSIGLARLGVKASILTCVGKDWRGQEVAKNLQKQKVDTKLLQYNNSETTALAFIVTTVGAHDHVAFVSRGASGKLKLPMLLSKKFDWCYATSVSALNWYQGLNRLFKQLKEQGTNIFWNPGVAQLATGRKLKNLLRYVTILDLNKEEAEILARDLKLSYVGLNGLLKVLKSTGPSAVLITNGAKGAYFYDGKKIIYHASLTVKLVNTTGAGDSFGAGFLAGYLNTRDIKQAMRWGMLNSSSVIMQAGAQRGLLNIKSLKIFLKKYGRA